MDGLQALGIAAVFVLAGGVKGVTGMGLPTVAVSLLGLWMLPAQAAALLVLPSLVTNLAQCRGPHARRLAARLWPLWVALCVATVAAPAIDGSGSPLRSHQWLGAVLLVYGAWGLWRPLLPDLSQRAGWLGAVVGAVTGLVTATTAVYVMPLVPYLQMLRLEKEALVQALGLSFTLATLALALRLQAGGGPLLSTGALLALAAALLGLRLGTAARQRLSGPRFQRVMSLAFVALGLTGLLRSA